MTATGVTPGYEPRAGTLRRRRLPLRAPGLPRVSRLTLAILAGLAGLQVMTALLFIGSTASGEASGWDRLPIDDAWTRMTYIRSFSESFSFEFTPGEASTGATSPLWTALNGTLVATFGIESDVLPVLAKALGIAFAAISAWIAFRVTWQITRRRHFGLLAGAIIAIEPHFGYAAVSGTEVTLFAAVSLAASWAYLRGRIRTAGAFTALSLAARPEGLLLVLLILGATFTRWLWRRDGALIERRRDVQDIAFLGLPSLAVITAWVTYNWSVTGNPLPDSYLATNEVIGLLPLSNLWNVWLGYLHELPFMDGLAWLVGLPLVLLGIYVLIRRHSFSAAPVALFALALVYAAMVTFTRPGSAWLFDDRRHLDPALPFIVILLTVGTARAWQMIRAWKRARIPRSERERKSILITARVAVAALVIAPLAALPLRWDSLTTEYSWNSRNVNDVNVAMGRWLAANTPEDAVIGVTPAGAISFFANEPANSRRTILDLDGKNTHDAQAVPALTYGLEQRVDYLVAFRDPFFDSIPDRIVAHEERVSAANPFQTNILRAYGPEGSLAFAVQQREQFILFDPTGLEVIDMLDAGNGFAPEEASETAHDYGLEGDRASTTFTMRVADDLVLTDDSRIYTVAEEFGVASRPGQPLTIVKRYDATTGGRVRVFVNGSEAGVWDLPLERTFFGEASFTVPPELISSFWTRLRFEVIPGPSSIAATSFYYWILVPESQVQPSP